MKPAGQPVSSASGVASAASVAGAAQRTFRWRRMGRIFSPDGRQAWMQSHAQNPAALVLDDRIRVYFNCRAAKGADGNTVAQATFVDLDRRDPGRVLAVNPRPVLPLGALGTFDQFGVMIGNVLAVGDEVWAYYVGWSRCQGVPYNHAIGLAISRDGGATFTRFAQGPIIARSPGEPFIQNSPFVAIIEGLFHMWYSSGTSWVDHGQGPESVYVLMHATSRDGIRWERDAVPCVPARVEHECQTNPCVLKVGQRFHLWFCYRHGLDFRNPSRGYRIGHAWSDDREVWHRDDAAGELLPSAEGWDSEMVCYPCVIELDGRTLMFYSGNYFGRDGFGYALLDDGAPAAP
jgi:hypothetical protein